MINYVTIQVALCMLHRLLSFWENQGCSIHCSLVVRTEILCILVHIVREPLRSIVVIVCCLKITTQSLQDLAYITAHSTWILLVLDLLIDCVHCDPVSFCLHCTLESLFYFCLTCTLYNMHVDTVVISSPGVMLRLLFIQPGRWRRDLWMGRGVDSTHGMDKTFLTVGHLWWSSSGGRVKVTCLL